MSITQTLTRNVAERQTTRQQDADRRYHELVQSAVDGELPDPDDIVAISEAAGRTHEDFITDVEAIEARLSLAAKLEDVPALQAEIRELRESISEDTARFEDLKRRIEASQARQHALSKRMQHSENMREELAKTCTDPKRLAGYQERRELLAGMSMCLQNARRRLPEALAEQRAMADRIEKSAGHVDDDRRDALNRRLKSLTEEVETLKFRIPELEQQAEQAAADVREYRRNVLAAV